MTDKNKHSLKNAFIATLCKHPKAADFQKDAFNKADIKGLYKKLKDAGEVITKADFLAKDENDNCFLTYERAWDNFHFIVDIVRENGEEFTAEDFLQISDDSYYKRPIIESMSSHRKLDVVFDAHVWQGRFEEMEDLWYYLPPAKRKEMTGDSSGSIPLDLKRQVMGLADDAELREDELKKIGVDYKDIANMFNHSGSFEAFLQNLYENNMPLKTEDLLFVNREGDTLFHHAAAWNSYDKIMDALKQSGESFGVKELTFKRGRKPSVIERAVQHNALDKVFTPKYWVGREEEMVNLWDKLLPAQKNLKGKSFDGLVADVEDMTYKSFVASIHADNVTKDMLLKPIVANDNDKNDSKVIPLGLRSMWQHMEVLRDGLKKRGEDLTVADLRQKTGVLENTVLMVAAESGNFDSVLNIVSGNSKEDNLQVQDFLDKNKNGTCLLDILIEKKQLDKVLAPEIWAGRLQEMHIIWNNVPERHRKQVDFSKIVSKVNRATIRRRGGNRRLKRGPKR